MGLASFDQAELGRLALQLCSNAGCMAPRRKCGRLLHGLLQTLLLLSSAACTVPNTSVLAGFTCTQRQTDVEMCWSWHPIHRWRQLR